jgi:hypothetical protein
MVDNCKTRKYKHTHNITHTNHKAAINYIPKLNILKHKKDATIMQKKTFCAVLTKQFLPYLNVDFLFVAQQDRFL